MDDAPATGRTVDIELGGQEVITIDLDQLDPDPTDVLDLLNDSQVRITVWAKIIGEYWRRGYLDAAEKLGNAAVEAFQSNGYQASLPPIFSLLANIQLARARAAPKMILPNAKRDILADRKTKEDLYRDVAHLLNQGDKSGPQEGNAILAFLTRGIQQLATRSMDDAMRSFEGVLSEKPTNIVALLGKGRILYARRQYAQSLGTFQQVLRLNPQCKPDPRIGIGLCLWALDQKPKAKSAWQRSLELDPTDWVPQLLLGLEAINSSKGEQLGESERSHLFLVGKSHLERAFKANQKNAAASNALCELLLVRGDLPKATKLAERTIQYADTLSILTEGYIRAGRVAHAEDALPLATRYYTNAIEGQPKHVLAAIGLAQMQIKNEEMAAAIHTLDTLLQAPNPQRSVEATVMLASLRAFPRPGVSSSDVTTERARARELYDKICKAIEADETPATVQIPRRVSRSVASDQDMHIEIARLWQGESNLDRTGKALREAMKLAEASGRVDPKILNNIGVLQHMEGKHAEARALYEGSLTKAAQMGPAGDGISTTMLFNLARVYEDQGDEVFAKDAYDKLLSRHPEYIDAKIRQAQLLSNINKNNDAHDLLKQALASQNANLNLRAFYTHFLIESNLPKPAKEFVFSTLKDHDKHDLYSLCAAGWIHYYQARESRDSSTKAVDERRKNFQRAAEFYEKALQLDPMCAIAAQGLAIVTAEDAMGVLSGILPASSSEEQAKRMKNSRDALDVFAKVRESISDGSVYLNMGHCYYARDEFDRAIESYETASVRFYNGHNVPVLLSLCRSWYAKGMKDQSYLAMSTAVRYAQSALHIQPNDKAVVYNIAMIQQKTAEMLFTLPAAKRTLKDLQRVIDQATHAQRVFGSLASDKAQHLPYSREIADQRRKYGDNMLKKKDEHIATQRQYEQGVQSKLDLARKKRQEERDRAEALERARAEELKKEAEDLAEKRRIAREQAQEWTREARIESDEEKERKVKRPKKVKTEGGSGDEAEPKKKRRGKLKKAANPNDMDVDGDGEEQATFTDEDQERPTKKRITKKRVVRDDDEEEEAANPRKKQFKSKEMLSDTDDEMA